MDQVAIFILLPMNKTERQLPLGLSSRYDRSDIRRVLYNKDADGITPA